jgi:plasmid stabilization system protein ParE
MMKPPILEIHPEATKEARDARQWYEARNQVAAAEFVEEMKAGVQKILDSPARWSSVSPGIQKYRLHRFPYSLIYRQTPTTIRIIAVAHGHRRPGYWKSRVTP